ncbi:hypothetical protein GOP47_0023114 [Adiantum capillus-veneris]|uniref:RNA helicase n=1 Tax=Adiantum capillus-veneris TaxID=13818 RepID=A0A9D4Z670_ADICA|nr:hypothetical protein GOP47_0023114 [Adiantum capillus-veneris]
MTGVRLLPSFMRRRSACRSLYVYAFHQRGICVLSDGTPQNCISSSGKRFAPRNVSDRAAEFQFYLLRKRLHSVCSERLPLYDEGLETSVQNQHDVHETCGGLPIDHEDRATSPSKSGIARRSKCFRAMEGSQSLVPRHMQSRERKATLRSRRNRAMNDVSYEDGDTESPVKVLDNNSDPLPDSMHFIRKEVKEYSDVKVNNNQEQLKEESRKDRDDGGTEKQVKLVSRKEPHAKLHDFSDVKHIFQVLLFQKESGLQKPDRDGLAKVFKHFLWNGWAKEQALDRYHISAVIFPKAVSHFRKFFFSRCTSDLKDHLLRLGPSTASDHFLFPLFWEYSSREFSEDIARYKALVETADLTKPHTWFPFARAMRRKVIYHSGPTNSGKTYNALQRFKVASSGIYCGPLRLLAMEVYDTMNADGVYCSLITGQEKKEVPFAYHVACTVEMVSTVKPWQVAILDEIQLIADEYRGWAWTRAFLGVQADEIHVCGDPSALKLVRELCAVTGDDLVEHSYERFEPLSISQESLQGRFAKVQPGDCIVTFSRKEIFSIKRAVELLTKNRCCVIYGALPPETRTHQAKLFNDPNSGYDVLVATDAVGMGLNLNIRRVIFHTFEKHIGSEMKKVSASQVKQIAGRAGRRGTQYHAGIATTFFSDDIPYLVQCMQEPFVDAHCAGLFPGMEQIELFAAQLPGATFAKLLDHFAVTCRVDGSFFLCSCDHLKRVASVIDKVSDLTLEDKISFILAPVNSRDAKVVGALLSFALAYSKRAPVHLAMGTPTGATRSVLQLMDLEARHQVLSLYLWLSHHLPEEYFPQREQAEVMAGQIALVMGEALALSDIRTVLDPHPARKNGHRNGRSHHARTSPVRYLR